MEVASSRDAQAENTIRHRNRDNSAIAHAWTKEVTKHEHGLRYLQRIGEGSQLRAHRLQVQQRYVRSQRDSKLRLRSSTVDRSAGLVQYTSKVQDYDASGNLQGGPRECVRGHFIQTTPFWTMRFPELRPHCVRPSRRSQSGLLRFAPHTASLTLSSGRTPFGGNIWRCI